MAGDGELAELESLYLPLVQSVRRLIDATIRTQADAATIAAVTNKIDCAIEDLSADLMPGSFGVRQSGDGHPYMGQRGDRSAQSSRSAAVDQSPSRRLGVERIHPRRAL